ncbi:hypothetical protein C4D60_Mb08t11100 [Musa balbisiana]|uniref:Ycf20-like protein n=1 Tax=Musa balbisiana TaxID=52838 RepID=A0A4S8K2Y2_MUSBA|nr:hypothetical protein C4D60_Mb08t11100 [Musa balbisiana]
MTAILAQRFLPSVDSECLERHSLLPPTGGATWRRGNMAPCTSRPPAKLGIIQETKSYQMRNYRWRTALALDTGGSPSSNGQENLGDNAGLGRTRLGTIVRAAAAQLLEKLNAARKNFPMKIFLLLLGFYTANALATILGQTGDWDVLVAGVVVAVIEGIGMLMYRKPFTTPVGRLQNLIVMVNYWKAGVCLGLFVDAFKLGS